MCYLNNVKVKVGTIPGCSVNSTPDGCPAPPLSSSAQKSCVHHHYLDCGVQRQNEKSNFRANNMGQELGHPAAGMSTAAPIGALTAAWMDRTSRAVPTPQPPQRLRWRA